jgi:hypothetical protein
MGQGLILIRSALWRELYVKNSHIRIFCGLLVIIPILITMWLISVVMPIDMRALDAKYILAIPYWDLRMC